MGSYLRGMRTPKHTVRLTDTNSISRVADGPRWSCYFLCSHLILVQPFEREEERSRYFEGGWSVNSACRRESDYGWFFMGPKRKENYDDWWRCEVAFFSGCRRAFWRHAYDQDLCLVQHLSQQP